MSYMSLYGSSPIYEKCCLEIDTNTHTKTSHHMIRSPVFMKEFTKYLGSSLSEGSIDCPGFLGECPHLLELADGDPQRARGKERVEERE